MSTTTERAATPDGAPAPSVHPTPDHDPAGAGTPGRPGTTTPAEPPGDHREVHGAGRRARRALRWAVRRLLAALLTLVTRTAAIALLLAVWETAPRLNLVDPVFLPPFSEVARAWWGLWESGQLTENVQASVVRSASGFSLAVVVAVPLGLLIGWYRPVADLLGPLLEVFRNTAALALLPVFVLLLGIGETSKISLVLYACTWPILLNTISAVRGVDPVLLRLGRSMALPAPRLFQKVILPAALPTIFTGVRLAGGVAVLVLVAAEMVGAKAGLGFLVNASQYNFAIPEMYAGIVTISALGVAFNQLLLTIERRCTRWRAPLGG